MRGKMSSRASGTSSILQTSRRTLTCASDLFPALGGSSKVEFARQDTLASTLKFNTLETFPVSSCQDDEGVATTESTLPLHLRLSALGPLEEDDDDGG